MGRPTGSKDKVNRQYKHSFARQFLKDHNTRVYNGDELVLAPLKDPLYKIKLPNTRFYAGQRLVEEGETRKITSYDALKGLGYVIISAAISEKEKWVQGQKVIYLLRRLDETAEHLRKIPVDHHVEHDPYKQMVRLIGPRAGPNNFGPWVNMEDRGGRVNAGRKYDFKTISENADYFLQEKLRRITGEEEEAELIKIPEAAFMITDANEIVCFPHSEDMPAILICGQRGSGKCIVQDANTDFILDGAGRWTKIEDHPKETFMIGDDLQMRKTKVNKVFSREVDEVLDITTHSSRNILMTPEHPVLTPKGWKRIDTLKKGDFIGVVRKYNLGLTKRMRREKIRLLLYLSLFSYDRPRDFTLHLGRLNYYTRKDFENLLKERFPKMRISHANGNPFRPYKYQKKIRDYCAKNGIKGLVNKEETCIPNSIMELCNRDLHEVINLIYGARGHLTKTAIVAVLPSKLFAKQVCHILLRFGIQAIIHHLIKETNSFNVIIHGYEDIKKFKTKFTPRNPRLAERLREFNPTVNLNPLRIVQRQYPPFDFSKVTKAQWSEIAIELGYRFKSGEYAKMKKGEHTLSDAVLRKMQKILKYPMLQAWLDGDVAWRRIREIKRKKGKFKVHDLEVEDDAHNFIANDIVVHNSYCLHSIVSRLFWKPAFDYKIAILNDSSRETGTWCLPNNDEKQKYILKRLNEKPLPLPCVYLHPLVKEDYEKLYLGDVGFDVTLSFKEVIENHEEYLNLKESKRYFTKIIDELVDCENEFDAELVLDQMILQYNIPPQTANKIRAELDTLFKTKMTDISTKGQAPWKTSKNKNVQYNPLTACLHAGLVPVLETEYVSNYKQIFQIYFNYFVHDLFNRQKQDPDFQAEMSELLLVLDEMHNISDKSAGKNPADMLLRRCVKEGRPRRLGTLLATQYMDKVPDEITGNTTHLIVFNNPSEANAIANRFNLGKHVADRIKDLKVHECMAYSTKYFVVYDSNGNKRKSKMNETFVGTTLPPYSLHKRPKKGGN